MQIINTAMKEVPLVTTNELIQIVKSTMSAHIETQCIEQHPAVFIQGQPGIGKSQAIHEIAHQLEIETHKKVQVTDVRLLLFSPIDLRGIPVANHTSQTAVWLKPEIFNLEDSEHVIHIFFLDELTAAPTSIQAAAYQIALDRKLGEHKLPKNTFVIAAGNRIEDHAVSYEMPTALRNRFMHFEIRPDLISWLQWATMRQLNPEIIDFLREHPDMFITKDLDTSSPIIVTPRSWEMLSNILQRFKGTQEMKQVIMTSIIGSSITHMMLQDISTYRIESILKGEQEQMPQTMSELQHVVNVLESRMTEFIEHEEQVSHVLQFLTKIPVDYALRVFQKIAQQEPKMYELTSLEGYHNMIRILEDNA